MPNSVRTTQARRQSGRSAALPAVQIEPHSPYPRLLGASPAALTMRIREVCEGRTNIGIGRQTGTHAESVRRYVHGARPSLDFIIGLALAYGISTEWLLFGTGSKDRVDLIRPQSNGTANGVHHDDDAKVRAGAD